MTRIIAVISGKGGVGKTTLVSNLGAALAKRGRKVTVIDGNVTGANLGLHLGLPAVSPVSINDVIKNDAFITQAIYRHPGGFNVVPAALRELSYFGGIKKHMKPLLGANDFILIDAAAGTDSEVEAAVESSDAVIIVTNPEHPAIVNALAAKKLAQTKGKDILGIVLNKVMGESHELTKQSVESITELPVLAVLHDQRSVREAIAKRRPVVLHAPKNKTSKEIMRLASLLCSEKDEVKGEEKIGILSYLHRLFSGMLSGCDARDR